MKKLIGTISLLCFFLNYSNAQFDVENLFGGGNIAYAKPIGDFSEYAKGGISFNIIAGYRLTEKLGVGIEYGSAATAALDDDGTGLLGLNIYGLSSYLAKGWYRFSTEVFRPYVGVGLGLAQVAEPDITSGTTTITGGKRTGFGANLELGINIKGFNLSYSFNIAGKGPKEPVFNPKIVDLPMNYHRFAAGYIYNF